MPFAPWLAGLIGLGLLPPLAAAPLERYALDLEWGTVWQQSNDVQSPNTAAGTRYALDALTGPGPFAAPRIEVSWPLSPRDDLRLLAAPLRIQADGTLRSAVNYEGKSFTAGATTARYRFDTYRLTWRRNVYETPDWTVKAGVTGKIRHADITLQQGDTRASRGDLGFVPLVHLRAERRLSERARLIFDGDGLASPRGRAFDLSMRYAHQLRPGWSAYAGVRVLDGGANNDSVYNFARFGYLTLGVTVTGN